MKIENIQGTYWLEPNHIKITEILNRLKHGESVDILKKSLNISDEKNWRNLAEVVFENWKFIEIQTNRIHQIVAEVNNVLADYALCLPTYVTLPEAEKLKKLVVCGKPNIDAASKLLTSIVMDPRIRALQTVGRFHKLDVFKEFAYFIDSAALSHYRGNIAAALFCLIPAIEGVLLRWQGYPHSLSKKPDFKKTIKFIIESIYRQPLPYSPNYFECYVLAANKIIEDHLYKDSGSGHAYNYFNRHLALHMLEDKPFCSPDNVMRAFLLIDLLSEIYICEKKLKDSRFSIMGEEKSHIEAYIEAENARKLSRVPEHILKRA